MKCILSEFQDPYFHLAAEELLLRQSDEEYFIIWRSRPAVITGKHQNTFAEINHLFIREENIKVARRLTGGGTVYHDEGNINFTFIRNGEEGRLVDFKKHVSPVIDFLHTKNIDAAIGEKNELLTQGLKISGNAEHVYKKRVLHHGTILFSSDLDKLKQSIKVIDGLYTDKGVKSNRSKVTNLNRYFPADYKVENFMSDLFDFIFKNIDGEIVTWNEQELNQINDLIAKKYGTWEWIYGYSPRYIFKKSTNIRNADFNVQLEVDKGLISTISITYKPWDTETIFTIENQLTGKRHFINDILETLQKIADVKTIPEEKIITAFF